MSSLSPDILSLNQRQIDVTESSELRQQRRRIRIIYTVGLGRLEVIDKHSAPTDAGSCQWTLTRYITCPAISCEGIIVRAVKTALCNWEENRHAMTVIKVRVLTVMLRDNICGDCVHHRLRCRLGGTVREISFHDLGEVIEIHVAVGQTESTGTIRIETLDRCNGR